MGSLSPSGACTPTSALKSATQFENEVGVQAPLGLWDPLGCLNGIDQDTFDRYRYAEIKHGRVAQLAFPGHFGASEVPVGWIREFTDDEKFDLRGKELNQGRAAMMGILGLMVHEYHFGNAYIFADLY